MSSAAIDLVEAAYDLDIEDSRWLPRLLEVGAPIIDQGLGAAGIRYSRPPEGGAVEILEMHMVSGPADFLERHQRAIATTPPDALREQARPHLAATMSENTRDSPEALEHYTSHVDYCKDLLGITAVDPNGRHYCRGPQRPRGRDYRSPCRSDHAVGSLQKTLADDRRTCFCGPPASTWTFDSACSVGDKSSLQRGGGA